MKFTRLIGKFNKLVRQHELGARIRTEKLRKLHQLLSAKKSRYETKLAATTDPDKRKKLETRLKVVVAQIEKSKQLPPAD